MPAVDNLVLLQEEQARARDEMSRVAAIAAQAGRERLDREESQATATQTIAQAQVRLQELQEQAVELASRQADATAEVAMAQQAVLGAVQEELAVLRDQSRDQRLLLRSSWSGGVVMEWTLLVAIVAAVATVTFALKPAGDLDQSFWIAAGTVAICSALLLALSQRRRMPSKPET